MSREGQGKAEARSRIGDGKVKVRSRQRKHNLKCNYNLMGFDTIEINLVVLVTDFVDQKHFCVKNCWVQNNCGPKK